MTKLSTTLLPSLSLSQPVPLTTLLLPSPSLGQSQATSSRATRATTATSAYVTSVIEYALEISAEDFSFPDGDEFALATSDEDFSFPDDG
jgi:hypothetical protein